MIKKLHSYFVLSVVLRQKCVGFIVKVKIVPVTSQVGTEGRWRVLSVNNLGARRGWVVSAFPQLLYPWKKKPGTNYTGGCVDLMAAVGESRKSLWSLNPGQSTP
jgi:hypothetical protein